MTTERKFLDRVGVEQLIKLLKSNFVQKGDMTGYGYATSSDLASAKSALEAEIANISTDLGEMTLKFVVVENFASLPEVDKAANMTVYLVPIADSTEPETNVYEEYYVVNGKWEKFGEAKVSLADYSTTEQINTTLESYQTVADMQTKVEEIVATEEVTKIINENLNVLTRQEVVDIYEAVEAGKPIVTKADGSLAVYDTVEEAITNAEEGDEITLNESLTLSASTEIPDGVTIDLNGYTLDLA